MRILLATLCALFLMGCAHTNDKNSMSMAERQELQKTTHSSMAGRSYGGHGSYR